MDDATKNAFPGDWRFDPEYMGVEPRVATSHDVTVAYVMIGNGIDQDMIKATAALMAESKRMAQACQQVAAAFKPVFGGLTDGQKDAVEACIQCLRRLGEEHPGVRGPRR